jgi:hypothetical protein
MGDRWPIRPSRGRRGRQMACEGSSLMREQRDQAPHSCRDSGGSFLAGYLQARVPMGLGPASVLPKASSRWGRPCPGSVLGRLIIGTPWLRGHGGWNTKPCPWKPLVQSYTVDSEIFPATVTLTRFSTFMVPSACILSPQVPSSQRHSLTASSEWPPHS